MRTCSRCHKNKVRAPTARYCAECHNIANRKWYLKRQERDPLAARRYHYKYHYGVTLEQRDELFAKNGGFCHICLSAIAVHLDHDHRSGKIRGALCEDCNLGIGRLKDDVEILRAAIEYLKS